MKKRKERIKMKAIIEKILSMRYLRKTSQKTAALVTDLCS